MLGVASNAFNGCVCRAWFRPLCFFTRMIKKATLFTRIVVLYFKKRVQNLI